MKKKIIISTTALLVFLTLTSFSVYRGINIAVRFVNINEHSDSLKLEFTTTYPVTKIKSSSGGKIDILKNDSLYMRFVTDSAKYVVDFWNFPSIPNGYRIVYPEFADTMLPFKKSDRLKFVFSSSYIYYGNWDYKPFYSDEKAKWLFDQNDKQKVIIKSEYVPVFPTRDVIEIRIEGISSAEFSDCQLFDDENNRIEIKHWQNTANNGVELKLKKNQKKGRKLRLSLRFGKGQSYEDEIIVPDRSIVRIF